MLYDIRLGRKWITETNTLAYHAMELTTAIKGFIVQYLVSMS
jgi:hypothetical protein